MSKTIEWVVPSTLSANVAYTINIYKSSGGEDGDYSLLVNVSAGTSNTTYTYTDSNGSDSDYYLVRYLPAGGVEGSNVLARIQPTVREQRLRDKIYTQCPEVVQVRIDSNKTQVRDAIQNALRMVNSHAPVSSYTVSNMPQAYEVAIEYGAQMLLYMGLYLQISIRDFSYGVSGISLNIDRGAKMNQALTLLTGYWNEYMKVVKFGDYPDAIGLGSSSIATPMGRSIASLYNLSL